MKNPHSVLWRVCLAAKSLPKSVSTVFAAQALTLLAAFLFFTPPVAGNTVIYNQTGTQGGACYISYEPLTFTDTAFIFNRALNAGGALYVDNGALTLAVGAGQSGLFSGNLANGASNALYLAAGPGSGGAVLTVETAPDAVLDMRDALGGMAYGDGVAISITKNGAGVWKLGGDSVFSGEDGGRAAFTVAEGALQLYRAGAVANANADDPGAMAAAGSLVMGDGESGFTLAGGATLIVGGGNALSAQAVIFESGSVLAFDYGYYDYANAAPMLDLSGSGSVSLNNGTTIDLLSISPHVSDSAILLSSVGFAWVPEYTITIRGEALGGTRAAAIINSAMQMGVSIMLNHNGTLQSEVVSWNTAGGSWNITDDVWLNGGQSDRFLHGDIVNFGLPAAGQNAVGLNPGGVQAAAVGLSGNADYFFSGGSLVIDGVGGTSFYDRPGLGVLALGGYYDDQAQFVRAVYTGTLDLGGSRHNEFSRGVELHGGTLRISAKSQLGYDYGRLAFKSALTAELGEAVTAYDGSVAAWDTLTAALETYRLAGSLGTLSIAQSSALTLLGVSDFSRAIQVGTASSGWLKLESGASLGITAATGTLFEVTGWLALTSAASSGYGFTFAENALAAPLINNSGAFSINGVLFNGNTGTAALLRNTGRLNLHHAAFSDNTGGSLIQNLAGTAMLGHAVFSGNRTSQSLITSQNAALTITAADFSTNAVSGGSALAVSGGTLTVAATQFCANSSGQGGVLWLTDAATAVVADTIFSNNTGLLGGAVHAAAQSEITLRNTGFTGNDAANHGGALYLAGSRAVLDVTSGQTMLFSGNTANGAAEAVYLYADNATAALTVAVAEGGVLDLRNPVNGAAQNGGQVLIDKNGAGQWKLGGDNVLSLQNAADSAVFNVNGGELYLYRAGEAADSAYGGGSVTAGNISLGGVFTVHGGARLTAMGGNRVSADTIAISSGATLGFGLTSDNNDSAILSLAAQNFSLTNGLTGALNFFIDLKNWQAGTYTLLTVTGTGADTAFAGLSDALLAAVAITLNDAALDVSYRTTLKLSADRASLVLTTAIADENTVLTWNAADGVWDTAAANWLGKNSGKYVSGDVVNFAGAGTTINHITIAGGGVELAGLYFSGGQSYVFSGGGITKAPDTELDGAPVTHKLVLGARAAASSLDEIAGFSGRVDFSGITAANAFAGVDIHGGTLVIGHAAQLGVTLDKLRFLAEASAISNPAVLEIAAASAVAFDGASTAGQRLAIDSGKSGVIRLMADGSAQNGARVGWQNGLSAGHGGAVYLADQSFLRLEASGDAAYLFAGNTALNGGAIYNDGGTLSLVNAGFSGNIAANAGGALYVRNGSVNLALAAGQTVRWSGNLAGGAANALHLTANGANAALAVNVGVDAVLDMRDPMSGAALTDDVAITKTGAGQWKLAGANVFEAVAGKIDFTVNNGELYLYRAGEASNANINDPTATVGAGRITLQGASSAFTLAGGAKLTAMGGNHIQTGGVLTISAGAKLAFGLDTAGYDGALLTLAAGSLNVGAGLLITVDFAVWEAGLYTLADAGAAGVFSAASIDAASLATLNGFAPHADLTALITTDSTGRYLQIQTAMKNYAMTWTPALGSNVWDNTALNWQGNRDWNRFAAGDAVNFANAGNAAQSVVIAAGGVKPGGLYFSGAANYTFSGGAITLADATGLTGIVAGGRLILGARASDSLLDTAAGFSGRVDFSDISGANAFNGVDIYGGTLIIATAAQLGVTLDKLNFLADATAPNPAALEISAYSAIAFDGASTAEQRLVLQSGKSGVIRLMADGLAQNGAQVRWQNGMAADGGAVYMHTGSVLNLQAHGNAAYLFAANTALGGGAIYNDGGALSLVNGSFSGNVAANAGGALYVRNGSASLVLTAGQNARWSGNLANGAANALHLTADGGNAALAVATAAGGVLDMRDPMSGAALAGDIAVIKTGAGQWKLAGASIFEAAAGKIDFAVNDGELYLYRANEVANANINDAAARTGAGSLTLQGAASSFTLASNAGLTSMGGNRIETAGSLAIAAGAALTFGLDTGAYGGALLSLSAAALDIGDDLRISVNIERWGLGTFDLVDAGEIGVFDDATIAAASYITLNGQALGGEYRAVLLSDESGRCLQIKTSVKNYVMTWDYVGNVWDNAASSWSGSRGSGAFWDGDAVNFRGISGQIAIDIQAAGVMVGGLYFSGNNYHAFTGGGIGAVASTELPDAVTGGRLVLGAWAADNDGLLEGGGIAAFAGTVDFSGITGVNAFTGVDIYGGTLAISRAAQLGVTPGRLRFWAAADADAPAVLEIVAGGSVVFDGFADPAAARLALADGKFGVISLKSENDGTGLIWRDSGVITANGGALYVGTGAGLGLMAETDAAYLFADNTALSGGAIYNDGGAVTLTNASFSGNNAAGFGGALLSRNGAVELNVLAAQTARWQGNLANGASNALHLAAHGGNVVLAVDTAAAAVLDMRDPMSGHADNGAITVLKDGAGTWRLGGLSEFSAANGGRTAFTVNGGTLYLYAAGEAANVRRDNAATVAAGGIILHGNASAFALGAGAQLTVAGQNRIQSGGSLSIAHGVALNFDLSRTTPAAVSAGNALLSLQAADYSLVTGGLLNFSVNLTAWRVGTFTLVGGMDAFAGLDIGRLPAITVAGQALVLDARSSAMLKSDGQSLLWLETSVDNNLVLDWRGASPVWDVGGVEWRITGSGALAAFADGDVANFAASSANRLTIQAAGISVGGVYFSGAGIYSFEGGGLATSGNSTLDADPAAGKLVLGGYATATGVQSAAFTGVVDFTGITGTNAFIGGIDIYGGVLRAASLAQLGTAAAKLRFLSDSAATGDIATLELASGGALLWDGAGTAQQRLGVAVAKAGIISLGTAAKLEWRNGVAPGLDGGALHLDTGAKLTLLASDNASYVFSGNRAASGGAVYVNGGELRLANTDFTGNNADIAGGALYNHNGGVYLGVAAGQTSQWHGNLAANHANALHLAVQGQTARLEADVASGALLDMRDALSGSAINGDIVITKSGGGVWKLGGHSVFSAANGGQTVFTVQSGELYLYRAGEAANANANDASATVAAGGLSLAGAASSFTLGQNARLTVRGGNHIDVEGTLLVASGATLDFALQNAANGTAGQHNAMLQLAANTYDIATDGVLDFSINLSEWRTGTFTLVSGDGAFAGVDAARLPALTVAGQALALDARMQAALKTDGQDLLWLETAVDNNLVLDWRADGAVWDISAVNWHKTGTAEALSFVYGDAVNFADTDGGGIDVQAAGVAVAGLYFGGTGNYAFSGGGIRASQASSLTGDMVSGKLVLGRTATATGLSDGAFSGVVDFTAITGVNDFAAGVDLYGGTLVIANNGHLGASAGNLRFLSEISNDSAMLAVAAGGRVLLDGAVANQRLAVAAGKSGVISLKADANDANGAEIRWRDSDAGIANGGALFVDTGAVLTLAAAGDAFYGFSANMALNGGAAALNGGTLTIANGVFTGNSAANTGGAIYNENGMLTMAVTADQTALFSGNTAAGTASSVYLQATGGFTAALMLDVAANASMMMLDPLSSHAASGSEIQLDKTGLGRWHLSGESVLTGAGRTAITVSAGDLYLYAAGTRVALAHDMGAVTSQTGALTLSGANSAFVLQSAASLTVNGGNRVSAGNIAIAGGATLNFNLDFAQTAMLQLNAANGLAGFDIGANLAVNVNMPFWETGSFTLVDAGLAGVFSDVNIGLLDVSLGGGSLGERRVNVVAGDNGRTLQLVTTHLLNVIMHWTGAEDGQWNLSAANWNDGGTPPRQVFSMYDAVNFDGLADEHVTIVIDQDVTVAGMYVSGNRNYSFVGASINADGAGSDLSLNSGGRLVLGAVAAKNGVQPAAFTGVVDFTAITGANDFADGVELHGGTLRISQTGQLGTALSGLAFLSTADASNRAVLRIAANSTLVFDNAGGTGQRLRIAAGKSGAIVLEDGASFVWQNGGGGLFGGALAVAENALFTLQSTDMAMFGFSGNRAMWGGALFNEGGLRINAADFSNNSATDSGGAVFNGPGAELALAGSTFTGNFAGQSGGGMGNSGKAELDGVNFTGNRAGVNGGAIASHNGALTLVDSSFIDNTADGLGGALYLYNGDTAIKATDADKAVVFSGNTANGAANSLHIAAGGGGTAGLTVYAEADAVLDMRDALTGMAGDAQGGGNIRVRKQGAGLWQLGGANVFGVDAQNSGKTDFSLEAGTLYLYGQNEAGAGEPAASLEIAGNGNAGVAANSAFGMASGSTLALGGIGHVIEVTNGGAVNLASGVTLGFNPANFSDAQTPALSIIAETVNWVADANGVFNLTVDLGGWRNGLWTLADFGLEPAGVKPVISVTGHGQLWDNERARAEVFMQGSRLVFEAVTDYNTHLRWQGGESAQWDYSARNWRDGDTAVQFINGDFVTFAQSLGGEISVAGGGITVSGMEVTRGDYVFSGGAIASAAALEVKYKSPELFDEFFTEKLVINGGSVVIHNRLNMANGVDVNSGTLGGRGEITGAVTLKSGARLSPGNSIGTLTINGSLTMEKGSVYDVHLLAGSAQGDRVVVNGQVSIDGAVINHVGFHDTGDYTQGGTWTILLSDTAIAGTGFAAQVLSQYAFMDFAVRHAADNKSVIMEMTLKSDTGFADYAYTRNQRAVAGGLQSLGGGALYNAILGLAADYDFAGLYDQLSGESHAGLAGMLQNYDRAFGTALRNRAADYDFSADGHPLWISADAYAMTAKGKAGTAQTELTGGGLTLGAEAQLGDGFMLGAAFRYSDGQLKADERHAKMELQSFSFALYSGWELGRISKGDWRVTAGASYGLHNVASSRQIKDAVLAQTLKADYDAHSVQVFGELAWRFNVTRGLSLEPYAGVSWNAVMTSRFAEKGGNAALHSDSRTGDNVASTLGLRGRLGLSESLSFSGDVYWQHLYGDTDPTGSFSFSGGDAFVIRGAGMGRNSLGLNLAAAWRPWPLLEIQGGYEGLFGDGYQSHGGNLKLVLNF